ncbi:inorganic pyrophosphatase 2-like protein [Tanacetum coccineum]|uniref:Inorganic pyrophosphatase 2-like protein n=1 Tax=Tanacetum coccineum TaxID=301880 RepID=A0ABQ4X596_9ASTR
MSGIVVIFDFDKTIIDIDSDNWVVDELGATDLFNQLLPTMPWNSVMDKMMNELHSQGKSIEDIEEVLKRIPIHPRVVPTIKAAYALGCDLRVLSDANMFYIETILKHYGILECFSEINTNPGFVDEEGKLRIMPYHDFHTFSHGCNLCPPNMCKGKIIERIQATLATQGKKRIIYLGDGAGDFCPSLKLVKDDYMMPRKDFPVWDLICKNQELVKAEVHEWTDGEDLERVLLQLIMTIISIVDENTNQLRKYKELKLEEKFRDLFSEIASTVKNKAEYIEDLERYPWLRDNVEATDTARVLKHAQKRNMEKVTSLEIMMDQSRLGVREKLILVQKLKDGMLGSDALLFDVHNDGVFFFVPLRYENGVVYQLRVTKDKKYDNEGLCEFLKEKLQQRFYAMFFKLPECELDVGFKIVQYDSDLEAMCEFVDAYGKLEMYLAHIPQNLAEYYYKNLCFDESRGEVIFKLRLHENRKKDAGNMSYEELVSWAEEAVQHLKTPPKPKISNAPESNLNVDESSVPFKIDDGDTGASFEAVDDHTGASFKGNDHNGPLSEAINDLGRDKIIEEDNIVKYVVDKGKDKMIEEERPVLRKAIVRNKESEDELIELRKINSESKGGYKVSKQKPCSNKEGGEGSSRPKTLYGLGENETVLEHEEFMDDLVRKLRDCDDDAELTNSFKLVGEKFVDVVQLKECLTYYGLANGFSLWFYRSSKIQVITRCGLRPERIKDPKKGKQSKWKRYLLIKHDEGAKCPWRCYGKQMTTENSFQVISLKDEHTCTRDFKFGTLVNYKWIGKHFGTKIKMNPDIKLHELADLVMKKSYAKAILESNDGSTVRVGVTVNLDDQTLFDRFYVCFSRLKEGWKLGCRRVIALDGCFIKKPNFGEDLDLPTRDGLTLISDQHKGFRKLYSGVEFRNLFWAAFKVSDPGTNCEAVENGFGKCFNVVLLRVRNKPLITMLEAVRVIVMERMNTMRRMFWHVIPARENLFKVRNGSQAYRIDEQHRTCSCRMWQQSGLPCSHAIAVIFKLNRRADEYVPNCFRKQMFYDAYHQYLTPIGGMSFWPDCSEMSKVLPLKPKKMSGRSKKKRIRAAHETNYPNKISRQRKTLIPLVSIDQNEPLVSPSIPIPSFNPITESVDEHLSSSQYDVGGSSATVNASKNKKMVTFSENVANRGLSNSGRDRGGKGIRVQIAPTQSSRTSPSEEIAFENQVVPVKEPVPRARRNFFIPRQRERSERILKRKLAKDHPGTGSSKTNPHSLD